jgi:hypothetical protein
VLDPEQRSPLKEDVAHGAAGEGADEGDREHAHHVHAFAHGLDETGQGEGHGAAHFNRDQQRGEFHAAPF